MEQPGKKDFIRLLKYKNAAEGAIDRLKTLYRPVICPFKAILARMEPQKSVFDVGYGSGQFLLLVAAFKNPVAIGGVEISNKLARNARTLLQDYEVPAQFLVYHGNYVPAEISNYDYVTLIDVLHHLPGKSQFAYLRDLASRMKSGSRLLLKDIDRASLWVWGNKIHDLVLAGETGNELNKHTARNYLEKAGLNITDAFTKRMFWYPHYLFVAEKP